MNPIPGVLDHFEAEMRSVLAAAGASCKTIRAGAPIEGLSAARKPAVALGTLLTRLSLRTAASATIVLWPAFGYLDVLTWLRLAHEQDVLLLVHDVRPLRPQFGHSQLARRLFGWAVRHMRVHPVCLTAAAAAELHTLTGVAALVAPHPVARPERAPTTSSSDGDLSIRVLGQHKTAREVSSLQAIAESFAGRHRLEIKGRGWGPVPGWDVDSRFLSNAEFGGAIATAGCLVLPYARFYQSNVAVRALENGVPVVARRHPHLAELFGASWPGFVQDDDWAGAMQRALSVPREWIVQRRDRVIEDVVHRWGTVLQKTIQ